MRRNFSFFFAIFLTKKMDDKKIKKDRQLNIQLNKQLNIYIEFLC